MCDAQVEWENALNLCVAHPLKNHKSQNISFTYGLHLISYTSKFKTVPCLIAAKSCVSEVKLCFRYSQIPYLKVNSIFKKFFVSVLKKSGKKRPDRDVPRIYVLGRNDPEPNCSFTNFM